MFYVFTIVISLAVKGKSGSSTTICTDRGVKDEYDESDYYYDCCNSYNPI